MLLAGGGVGQEAGHEVVARGHVAGERDPLAGGDDVDAAVVVHPRRRLARAADGLPHVGVGLARVHAHEFHDVELPTAVPELERGQPALDGARGRAGEAELPGGERQGRGPQFRPLSLVPCPSSFHCVLF